MFFQLTGRHRFWFTVAYAVASSPLVIGTFVWIKSLSWVALFGLGIILGILPFALQYLTYLHRSQLRRGKALRVAQLCLLDVGSLTRILARKAVPTWFRQDLMYEKVTWLNAGLEEIWPSLNEAASGLLKGILQSVLDPYKFSVIQKIMIKSVTLGTVSPLLSGVKFTEGGEDEAILEVELDWRHGQDAKIVIQLQTTGPLLTVQIKDFVVFGVLRVIFKPLKEQFPGFGAVIISLREAPTVDFQTKILGGDILMIPGVGNAVDNIILTALTDILVWPNRLVIPIMQGDYSYLQLKSVGQLDIQLVEAQHIPKADIWGESDPYAIIYIRRKQGCIKTSKVMWNTSCPVWNENFTLDVEDPETQKLTIKVYDCDRLKIDDFIGAIELPLSQFEPNQEQDIWIDLTKDLQNRQLKSRGKVHLRILYKLFASEKTVAEPVEEQLGEAEMSIGAEESSEGSKSADMLKSRGFSMDKPIITGNTVPEQISGTEEVNDLTHLMGVNEGVVGTEAISNEEIKSGIEVL